MKLRDDSAIWRVRLVWLGWDGVTLPVHLPYQQWATWLLVTLVLAIPLWLLSGTFMAVLVAGGTALFVTSIIWDRVDPDRPARKVLHTALTDWRTSRPEPQQEELPALNASHVTLGGQR